MFDGLKKWNTVIFIDYSNLFFSQYTTGWMFDLKRFFYEIEKDSAIDKTFFFGAYNELLEPQKKRALELQSKYSWDSKIRIFFKKLIMKWHKNKWNVDTEMWYYLSQEIQNYDTLMLFSGDGDFYSILKDLVETHKKSVYLFSTSEHIWAELYKLKEEIRDKSKFDIFDINSDTNLITRELKWIIRGKIRLYKELMWYYQNISADEIQRNIEYIQSLIDWGYNNNKPLFNLKTIFPKDKIFSLKNSNNKYIRPIIKKRKKEDKERLVFYLKTLK